MPFDKRPLQNYLGIGIIFPIELDPTGRAVLRSGWDIIKSSIRTLLSWQLGTRYFLGQYGTRLEELLEEPSTLILKNTLATFAKDAIRDFEKRVEVVDVTVTPNDDRTRWDIGLTLRLVNSRDEDSMIWPYYTQITY